MSQIQSEKTVSAEEAKTNLDAILDSAQQERIVITRCGKPSAVIIGIESYDAEDFELASSPEFWAMIQERRRESSSIPLAEVKAKLAARERAEKKARANNVKNGRKKQTTR